MSSYTYNITDTDIKFYIGVTKHHTIRRIINGISINKNCSKLCNTRVNSIVKALDNLKEDKNQIYGRRRII